MRTWLPDRSLISVRSYWRQIWRIWDLTHLDEHCGKEGSSTRQNTCEYHAGGPFGIVSDQPSMLLAKSQGRSQYVVHFRDDGAGWFKFISRCLLGNEVYRNCQASLLSIGPCAEVSVFHLPLSGAQSHSFIFQIKTSDKNSSLLLPILLRSKAKTRCVHGMGAQEGPQAVHAKTSSRSSLFLPMNRRSSLCFGRGLRR